MKIVLGAVAASLEIIITSRVDHARPHKCEQCHYGLVFVKGDEFDGPHDGPIPPYERSWRHPTEVAHDARSEFIRQSSPPPLSRRTSVIVAVSSVAASALLLVIAVPKGIERTTESPDTSVATVAVKNAATDRLVLTVDNRTVSALPVGGSLLVTSADAIDKATTLSVRARGVSRDAMVVGVDDATGIAVIKVDDDVDVGNALSDLPPVALPEDGMQVVHGGSGEAIPCHPSLELAHKATDVRAPIITDSRLDGAGTVIDAYGTPLGVAVRSQVATWLVSGQVIEGAVARILEAQ